MEKKETLRVQLEDTLWLQHKIRLFAMSNLSQDNPFRPLIEEQTCQSVAELRSVLDHLKEGEVEIPSK